MKANEAKKQMNRVKAMIKQLKAHGVSETAIEINLETGLVRVGSKAVAIWNLNRWIVIGQHADQYFGSIDTQTAAEWLSK